MLRRDGENSGVSDAAQRAGDVCCAKVKSRLNRPSRAKRLEVIPANVFWNSFAATTLSSALAIAQEPAQGDGTYDDYHCFSGGGGAPVKPHLTW